MSPVGDHGSLGVAWVVGPVGCDASGAMEQVRAAGYWPVVRVASVKAASEGKRPELALAVCQLACGQPECRAERGLEDLALLLAFSEAPRVVVTCPAKEGRLIARALEAGADGYAEVAAELPGCLERFAQPQEAIHRLARWVVGRLGVKEAVSALRGEMVMTGLRRENFSRRAAAKVLGVDRRVIQRAISEDVQAYARPDAQEPAGGGSRVSEAVAPRLAETVVAEVVLASA